MGLEKLISCEPALDTNWCRWHCIYVKQFRRHLKIKTRRMKRYWGTFDTQTGAIEIDPRATPKKRLEVIMHEALHGYCPDWTEKQMRTATRALRDVLWRDGYRRIHK